jgi:hypothetical protein
MEQSHGVRAAAARGAAANIRWNISLAENLGRFAFEHPILQKENEAKAASAAST